MVGPQATLGKARTMRLGCRSPFRGGMSARRLSGSVSSASQANEATDSGKINRRKAASASVGVMMALLGGKRDVSASAAKIDVNTLLDDYKWPDEFPFRAQDFARFDEGRDTAFYSQPRFVTHIDDGAIKALTKFYDANLPKSGQDDVAILDICSSWISHLPKGYSAGQIVGLGMNEEELKANEALTSYNVQDLNENPKMPYEDNTFDAVLNAVSVDYMTKPLQLFQEIHRVLKPGGTAIMSFSNRCFPTKAIAIWTQTGDPDHVLIVGSYFHYAGGFEKPVALDISPPKSPFFGAGDPMYVVYARKPLA